jgi:glucan phosphoethanolaminetransferase (alkaline phosphatase superfamily)
MQPKIKSVSRLFKLFFQIVFIILPILHLIAWVYAPEPLLLPMGAIISAFSDIPILYTLSFSTKLLGFLVSAVPLIVMECMLYFLIQLFGLYQQNEIFSLKNVQYLKKIGYALLIAQLAKPIFDGFLLSMLLTWHNPHGHRFASISIQGLDLALVLTAFLVILIAWIMAEGCRLREEQKLTI